ETVRRLRTRPCPVQLLQGSVMISPVPAQVGHGRLVMMLPSRDRWTDWISPCPWHIPQVAGGASSADPFPRQVSHRTPVSTSTSLETPVAHSWRSSVTRMSASEPGWTRLRGPRDPPPAPPPKNASKTSPRPPPPKPPPPEKPPP